MTLILLELYEASNIEIKTLPKNSSPNSKILSNFKENKPNYEQDLDNNECNSFKQKNFDSSTNKKNIKQDHSLNTKKYSKEREQKMENDSYPKIDLDVILVIKKGL